MLFLRKTDEAIWNPHPPFLENPPFQLPPTSEKFFLDLPLCPNLKNKITLPPNLGGTKLWLLQQSMTIDWLLF